MRSPKLIACFLVLAVMAFWGYRKLFPPDKVVIRNFLIRTAATASISPNESGLNKLAAVKSLANSCTADVQLALDAPGLPVRSVQGREQLSELIAAVRATVTALSIELMDIGIEVAPDRTSAAAQFICRARLDNADPIVQEFRVKLKRIDGVWRLERIEALSSLKM